MSYDSRSYNNQNDNRNNNRRQEDLPLDYKTLLKAGYFEPDPSDPSKKVLKKSLIIGYPEKIALVFGSEFNRNASSQLRRFYDYGVQLKRRTEDGCTFGEIRASFCQMLNFARYACRREKVSMSFVEFIEVNVAAVGDSKENFLAFMLHFEAVIANLKNNR